MAISARLFLLTVLPLLLSRPVYAQATGVESIFRGQLIDLHSRATAILDRLDRFVPQGTQEIQTRDELFALVRLAHRLDEEAGSTNLQLTQRGQPPSKTLLMVQQAAMALDGMLNALDFYITSGDRSFLGFARDNNAIIWSVRKVL